MKRAIRLQLTGSIQSMFFRNYIKENVEKNNVSGYLRNLEDGRVEIFLEGDNVDVEKAIEICKKGPQHAKIREITQKEEKLQDFKEFKILNF